MLVYKLAPAILRCRKIKGRSRHGNHITSHPISGHRYRRQKHRIDHAQFITRQSPLALHGLQNRVQNHNHKNEQRRQSQRKIIGRQQRRSHNPLGKRRQQIHRHNDQYPNRQCFWRQNRPLLTKYFWCFCLYQPNSPTNPETLDILASLTLYFCCVSQPPVRRRQP